MNEDDIELPVKCECGALLVTYEAVESHFREKHPSVYMEIFTPAKKERYEEIDRGIQELLDSGDAEVFTNEKGERSYRLTEKGFQRAEKLKKNLSA